MCYLDLSLILKISGELIKIRSAMSTTDYAYATYKKAQTISLSNINTVNAGKDGNRATHH